MHKTEMYIRRDQVDVLHDVAYVRTKERGKRVSVSQLVRDAIDLWIASQQAVTQGVDQQTMAVLDSYRQAKTE